jgi:hypothetical protein
MIRIRKSDKQIYYSHGPTQTKQQVGCDALPSPRVNPLEGSPKSNCGKLGLGRRSRLPTLERSRGSNWEPMD